MSLTIPPAIGQIWTEWAGTYAGVSAGESGQPDAYLVLLTAVPEADVKLIWSDAVAWALALGGGARLPTRFESALLHAHVHDMVNADNWHWTGTPDPGTPDMAYLQYFFNGIQYRGPVMLPARARAVIRVAIV
jgi:hypothetical protein